jgi:uncharacterized membrane protein YfhO
LKSADTTSPGTEEPVTPRTRVLRALGFSALFTLAGILTFWYLPAYGSSNIWHLDGIAQHYPALYAYNVVVRGFLHHPLAGFPTWSWHLGLGADLLGTLQYYMFDPFAVLSLAFPMHSMELAYLFLYVVKLFAAGAMAYLYLRELSAKPFAASAGALIYVFSRFELFCAFRSPDFATPVVIFPLLLLGIERVLKGRRPYLLVFAVFLAGATNFYYFYQMTIVVVLYAAVRYFELTPAGERGRRFLPVAAKTAGYYLLGTAIAAVSLIPVVFVFFASSRAGGHPLITLFAGFSVYKDYILGLVSMAPAANSAYLGFAMLGFLALPALFMRRRENLTVKVMTLAFVVFLVFPFFGSLFNGMSFPSYRITFAWGLFLGAAAALILSDSKPLSRNELIATLAALLLYNAHVVGLGDLVQKQSAAPALIVGYVTWALFAIESWLAARANPRREDTADAAARGRSIGVWLRYGIIALVVLNIAANADAQFGRKGANMLVDYEPLRGVQAMFDRNGGSLASGLPRDGFFRVDKLYSTPGSTLKVTASNDALVQGYNGISFYYSMMNAGVLNYLRALDNRPMRMAFDFNGFDGRAAMLALNAVKYYIARDSIPQYVPYGFTPFKQVGRQTIYVNDNALPLGYVYHSQLPRAVFDAMTPLERQQALLNSAVIDTATPVSLPTTSPASAVIDVPYSAVASGAAQVDLANNRFRTLRPFQEVALHFAPVPDAELYVDLVDLKYRAETPRARKLALPGPSAPASERAAYKAAEAGIGGPSIIFISYGTTGKPKTERNEAPSYPYYWGDNSQLVNLGYLPAGSASAFIRPGSAGVFSYSALKVYAVPMKGFAESISRLRDESLQNVKVKNDAVSATFSAKGDGLLFLSIPYSTGWRATVDGRPVRIVRANLGFSGIPVSGGTHALELRYTTPGLKAGAGISLAALVLGLALAAGGVLGAPRRAS